MAVTQVFEKSTAIAALVFSYTMLWDIPFTYRTMATLVSNLQATLLLLFCETGSFLTYESIYPNFWQQRMLWALALGGMAAEGKTNHPWFCAQLKQMCLTWEIRNWDELNDAGQRFWIMCGSLIWLANIKIMHVVCPSLCTNENKGLRHKTIYKLTTNWLPWPRQK